ncbi:MAG: T9SS type A sorting domain-containing protein [candidate division WOR-3 bacterium]
MKKLLTLSLFILLTGVILLADKNDVDDVNYNIKSQPDIHRNYIIPPQPVLPDDENSTQLYSLPETHRNYIIPPQPVLPDDENSTQLNSAPENHRNYVIPPQPVLPDDDNSVQLKSSPDKRRQNILPPNPINPQNPITFSNIIDLKNFGEFEIEVYNLNGERMNSDLNFLPAGKYLLLLKNGKNIFKEKIVILK